MELITPGRAAGRGSHTAGQALLFWDDKAQSSDAPDLVLV